MVEMISTLLFVLSFEEKKTYCEDVDKFNCGNVRIWKRHFYRPIFLK